MTLSTHCLPSGSLGTHELPVPPVPGTGAPWGGLTIPAGTKRGVVVFSHGWNLSAANTVSPTFFTNLTSDGWIVLNAPHPEDLWTGTPSVPGRGLFLDVQNDAGHGARYLTSYLHTWDHIVQYIHKTFGNWPIVAFGHSWGGWHALQVAANRTSQIVAYGAHCPVNVLSILWNLLTYPDDWSTLTTTGMDLTAHMLDAINIPGTLGWSIPDGTVDPTGLHLAKTIATNAVAAGMPLTTNDASPEGHAFSATDVTTYTNWFTSTVDPLAPKVH